MRTNPQKTADLITFNEEILNAKLHFLSSDSCYATQLIIKKLREIFLFDRWIGASGNDSPNTETG